MYKSTDARRREVREMCLEVRQKFDICDLFPVLTGGVVLGSASSTQRKARCPYPDHEDETPSFTLYSKTQKFYCFGCQRSGDAVNLARDFGEPGLSMADAAQSLLNGVGGFKPAAELYSKRSGLGRVVVDEKPLAATDYGVIAAAQAHYHRVLFSDAGDAGMRYLLDRGVSRGASKLLGLGFGDGGSLASALREAGIERKRAVSAGLLSKRGYERFANRVILPEVDESGKFVWMVGRAVSANMPRFQALPGSRIFYGLSALKKPVSCLVVVEGVFDYLLLRSWGYSVIGLGGGVLPERAALSIEALAPDRVAIALDNDEKGDELGEALRLILGDAATCVSLPDGVKDVSDLAGYGNGRRVFERLIGGSL